MEIDKMTDENVNTGVIKRTHLFGDYLKRARYNSKMTPREICRNMKLDINDYYDWEKSNKLPNENVARRLIKYLKMDESILKLIK